MYNRMSVNTKVKVVVVGAGPAGLISLRTFQREFGPGEIEVVCYERRGQHGGEWIFMEDQEETYDKAGNPLRTTLYKELQMNSPAVLLRPHPDHDFPPGTKLYPDAKETVNYFDEFAKKFDLDRYIKFNKMVADISYDKETSKFSMKIHDLKTGEVASETCDYVYMYNGQFSLPREPEIDMSGFTGEWFHYHDLRDPARMKGKRVLVVGRSWGAMDMAILMSKPDRAKSIHVSYNRGPPIWRSSKNDKIFQVLHKTSLQFSAIRAKLASIHPYLKSVNGKTFTFQDDSTVEVDAMIFCGGFTPMQPVSEDLKLDFEPHPHWRFLFPLYKHLVHPKCPRLLYLSRAFLSEIPLARPQAQFGCMLMKGETTLPSEAEMLQDIDKFRTSWSTELDKLPTMSNEQLKEYAPFIDLEVEIGNSYSEMCPGVARMYPENVKHICYQAIQSALGDVLHYKNYVVQYRPNPKKPGEKLPYFVPPPSCSIP